MTDVRKVYKNYVIPEELWNFFNTEPGLSITQLTNVIDAGPPALFCYQVYPAFKIIGESFCVIRDLIRFYRDHPPLSVDGLLRYSARVIYAFAKFDDDFKFHRFLLENKLVLPDCLVNFVFTFDLVPHLCNYSGIEYLHRKILSVPDADRQLALNDECAEMLRIIVGFGYPPVRLISSLKELVLMNDSLAKESAECCTIEARFLAHKNSEPLVAKYKSPNGMHSLFWQAAKAAARMGMEAEILKANNTPEHITKAVMAARPYAK